MQRRVLLGFLILAGAFPGIVGGVSAQVTAPAQAAPGEPLRVFLDCTACDFDYTRRTIRFVDWVRERQDAQVHALVTARVTGSGGAEYRVNLIGQQAFEGETSLSLYTTDGTDTRQEVRQGLVHTLELALLRFTAGTSLGEQIRVLYNPVTGQAITPATPARDPWDFWVFSLGLDGSFSGEKTASSASYAGAMTANRTTESWKIRMQARGSYSEDRFELSEDADFTSISRDYRVNGLVVGSLDDHWSLGFRFSGQRSTFSNTELAMRFAPALEFSIFPYAESSERDLRFLYTIGANRVRYAEETIYRVTKETLYEHTMTLALDLVQPWGTAEISLQGSAYLDDIDQHAIGLETSSDLRIFRGLSFTLFGGVSRIANQRSLSAGGATDEEILLRRRERATSFRYFVSAGISFTFGSRFANVVNPRLGS